MGVKLYDRQGQPIYESTGNHLYSDAVKLYKKITAQIEAQQRTGGDADSVRIGQLLDEFLSDGTNAKDETKYIYSLVIENKLKPFFSNIRASKLTTDHTKAYRKQRKAELLARKLASCPKPTREELTAWNKSAGATVNRELARLRSTLEYASKQTPPKVIRISHFHLESEAEAGAKPDAAFEAALGNRNGDRNGNPAESPDGLDAGPSLPQHLLKKLSSFPEEKLKTLVALLGA